MYSQRQTAEQQRAARAWQAVQLIEETYRDELGRKYNSLARGAPAMVQANGLGQTLAFYRAKAGPGKDKITEHRLFYNHLSVWVMSMLAPGEDEEGLLEWLVLQDTQMYRRATAETLAYMIWLKRFAEAVLPEATPNEE